MNSSPGPPFFFPLTLTNVPETCFSVSVKRWLWDGPLARAIEMAPNPAATTPATIAVRMTLRAVLL
jgi:hypothetical protein